MRRWNGFSERGVSAVSSLTEKTILPPLNCNRETLICGLSEAGAQPLSV